jgi:hypothetical protein
MSATSVVRSGVLGLAMGTNGGQASDIEPGHRSKSDSGMILCKHVFHIVHYVNITGHFTAWIWSYISEGEGEPIWTAHGSGEISLSQRVSAFIKRDR